MQSLREAHQFRRCDIECLHGDTNHHSGGGAPDHFLSVYAHLPRRPNHCGEAVHVGWSIYSKCWRKFLEDSSKGPNHPCADVECLVIFQPTSPTSDLNVDCARLIYWLVMKMDMDLGSMISSQITQIAQSISSRLGFPTLIASLCDAKGVISNTLTLESLSPVINLAYIRKNYRNPIDPSIVFPRPQRARARATLDALPFFPPSVVPPPAVPPLLSAPPSLFSTHPDQLLPMLQSLHQGQYLIMKSPH